MVATLVLLGTPEPDSMLHSFLISTAAGGGLGDEGEGAIGIHGDDHGNNQTHVILGALVELLGESGDVHAVLAQSGTNGGCGGCLACRGSAVLHNQRLSVP
mgnify:CR=1 FL=1